METELDTSSFSHFTMRTECKVCGFLRQPVENDATSPDGLKRGECPDCARGQKRLTDIPLPSGVKWKENNRIKTKWKVIAGKYSFDGTPVTVVEYTKYGIGLDGLSADEVKQLLIEVANV